MTDWPRLRAAKNFSQAISEISELDSIKCPEAISDFIETWADARDILGLSDLMRVEPIAVDLDSSEPESTEQVSPEPVSDATEKKGPHNGTSFILWSIFYLWFGPSIGIAMVNLFGGLLLMPLIILLMALDPYDDSIANAVFFLLALVGGVGGLVFACGKIAEDYEHLQRVKNKNKRRPVP